MTDIAHCPRLHTLYDQTVNAIINNDYQFMQLKNHGFFDRTVKNINSFLNMRSKRRIANKNGRP
ncbi:hypothetical protein GTNG_3122 [Geobacillus thermodenitrificans NG80-2]|uniref:Uncharacterized protein n=1 Tax=Geobacillus thermodenitrificans (strain NG80-2) TaxID=420246 RepID=A4IT13_GEOTN|nr:hypothetical protein GTNG_3122 [Geobacillus thermodenitrificans NG80-2]